MEDAPLQTVLDRLAEADIFIGAGPAGDAYYRFKHALIAGLRNLLKSRRQVLHIRLAKALPITWTNCHLAVAPGSSVPSVHGSPDHVFGPFPPRPRCMHWKTYYISDSLRSRVA